MIVTGQQLLGDDRWYQDQQHTPHCCQLHQLSSCILLCYDVDMLKTVCSFFVVPVVVVGLCQCTPAAAQVDQYWTSIQVPQSLPWTNSYLLLLPLSQEGNSNFYMALNGNWDGELPSICKDRPKLRLLRRKYCWDPLHRRHQTFRHSQH